MKFISAIILFVLSTAAFGSVMRASYVGPGNAGTYAGQPVQQAPTAAPTPAPYVAPVAAPATAPASPPMVKDEKCWMETKKCCWVEKEDGYQCRDNYDTKMARCNRKYKYTRKCDKAEKHGQVEKPEGRVEYGRCEKVNYDPNYGPHVAGYPTGMSDTYHSKELPTKPYKVDAMPHAPYTAPALAQAPATGHDQNRANNEYRAPAGGY